MKKKEKLRTRLGQTLGALAVIGLVGAGCQNLDVINTIDPDRARAAANPSDVAALIGGAYFPNFFQPTHGSAGGLNGLTWSYYGTQGADQTATFTGGGSAVYLLDVLEPGQPLENASTICSTICQWGPRDLWGRLGRAASIPFDGLQILNDGMILTDEDGVNITDRARAFSKFMQGLSWGYGAIVFDRFNVVPETVDLNAVNLQELNISSLLPYNEVLAAALASIDEAIQIAQQNPTVVHFPAGSTMFGTAVPTSNAQFIQMANTLAARLIVLSARTPAERATLNWQSVLTRTANGVTPGNEVHFVLTGRTSQVLVRAQQNTTTGTASRWDYRTIGMADQSGAYQNWISASLDDRDRFDIVTPDRRITGPTPTSNGSYTCYRADNNGFPADRPFYLRSAYQWRRHMLERGVACTSLSGVGNAGTYVIASADENNLLRAEALLRTGNIPGAVTEINKTRTRAHLGQSLPPLDPVTGAVPTVAGQCVPRTDAGACGTIWTALRYERMVELTAVDGLRGWADSRGFGMLPDGFPVQTPVTGDVLQLYGLPAYTYGGVGTEFGAVYAPVN